MTKNEESVVLSKKGTCIAHGGRRRVNLGHSYNGKGDSKRTHMVGAISEEKSVNGDAKRFSEMPSAWRGRRRSLSLLFFLHSGDRSAPPNAARFRVTRSALFGGADGDLPQGLGATMEATDSARREQSSQHGSGQVLHRGSDSITTSLFKSRGRSSVTDVAYLLLAKQRFTPTVGDGFDFRRGPDADGCCFDRTRRSLPLYLEFFVR
ncbi:hypothetical protein VNO77_43918 [Canavalia gladiata]|uniref:Uncharacterized protein n=1 Tax=Canavalia gladiata TaxID=3824 RepID=A0AAN9PPV7_CANGL